MKYPLIFTLLGLIHPFDEKDSFSSLIAEIFRAHVGKVNT